MENIHTNQAFELFTKEAHPVRSKAHGAYALAIRMVGNRKSKGELVELVCWLLQKTDINNL